MKPTCPYLGLPQQNFWRAAVTETNYADIVPQREGARIIGAKTKVASAGSCFAQHIAAVLKRRGFAYLDAEPGPAWLDQASRAALGYGLFSARFGNIYSSAQLEQLFERAYGRFVPADVAWEDGGAWFDPFRPSVEPGGFASLEALGEDRERHLAAVRHLFETVEVFVFTLGLTETWRSREDGAVFPVCPGCSVGDFDPERYEFRNVDVGEVRASLERFLTSLAAVNSTAHVILTVSPIPLAATFADRHVIEASSYSKAVLRVAAEEVCRRAANVHYFASYEIVTGARRADYFTDDQRSASPLAVAHVMRAFFALFADETAQALLAADATADAAAGDANAQSVLCDEDKVAQALALHRSWQ